MLLKTMRPTGDEEPSIESLEREQHIPEKIDPDVHNNPTLVQEPLSSLLPRLLSSVPRMMEYTTLVNELYGLRTEPDFSDFRDGYDFILPRVKLAQEAAKKYISEDEKTWVRRILNEFVEYKLGAHDLVPRLSGDLRFFSEKLLTVLETQGAEQFKPQHIALEMAARLCGCDNYQYTIKRLEDFRAGNFPVSGKTRKWEHEESITPEESIFLISKYL